MARPRLRRLTDPRRCPQGPPRAHLEHQLLAGWKAVRDWERGWDDQDVEELLGPVWTVASGPGVVAREGGRTERAINDAVESATGL